MCGTNAVSAYMSMGHPGKSNKRWRSELPAALPLGEHTYRHPSSCPVVCHASQEDADGFTLNPALAPLFRRLSSLPSHLHLSAICSILPSPLLPCYLTYSAIYPFPTDVSLTLALVFRMLGTRLPVRICRKAQENMTFRKSDPH